MAPRATDGLTDSQHYISGNDVEPDRRLENSHTGDAGRHPSTRAAPTSVTVCHTAPGSIEANAEPLPGHQPIPHGRRLGPPPYVHPEAPATIVKTGQKRLRRRKRKRRVDFKVRFLNMNGARHEAKWEELYRMVSPEQISLYAVAETHLGDLGEPPVHPEWCWAGTSRDSRSRKGGGVGVLWRRTLSWQRDMGNCTEHKWITGELLRVPTAICVGYFSVHNVHSEVNSQLVECLCGDIRRMANGKELLIVGDFNGHLSELDGYTDAKGDHLRHLAARLEVQIANLGPRCHGQYTWCAHGSVTCIDYALVSPRLSGLMQCLDIDEEGIHSLGSDHNRLRIDFSRAHRKAAEQSGHSKCGKFLPKRSVEQVATEF
ncbi:hypothetical protein HPB49_022834 [Dermacentor silvarum]|uniref:Uncharacterized protein n=1 Tax=Dermacentor silvarum TaxID=543639 RepID=A0ACB8DRB1_DERSI|nr:hypothetical protein HPB49_022834 [Dermacentor silvarum]